MAQLVKLYDYISRYETNPFHYPSRFIRLKQENWQQYFKKQEDKSLSPTEVQLNKRQHMQDFLNQLLPFQYKWAISTLSYKSYTDNKHRKDETLTFFLQRFPDIYLLLYYPLFSVKKVPVDGEIILISPIGIEIIHVVEEVKNGTIVVNNERTWQVESNVKRKSIMSPIITLKRTEHIITSILNMYEIELPIQKTVLSETNNFLHHTLPYKTNIIGKKNYEDWFLKKRKLQSPLKNIQLKAMEAILKHCQSSYVRRPEWEDDDDTNMSIGSLEEN